MKKKTNTHRTGSWYLLGVVFKTSDEHTPPPSPGPFHISLPRGDNKKILKLTATKEVK